FFSSRRRHTRFSRDWSSDVCSSDLVLRDPRFGVGIDEASLMLAMTRDGPGIATMVELSRWMLFRDPPDHTRLRGLVSKAFTPRRSEERRVGKEWRTGW